MKVTLLENQMYTSKQMHAATFETFFFKPKKSCLLWCIINFNFDTTLKEPHLVVMGHNWFESSVLIFTYHDHVPVDMRQVNIVYIFSAYLYLPWSCSCWYVTGQYRVHLDIEGNLLLTPHISWFSEKSSIWRRNKSQYKNIKKVTTVIIWTNRHYIY